MSPASIAQVSLDRVFDTRSGAIIFTARTTALVWLIDLLILPLVVALKYAIEDRHEMVDLASSSVTDILIVAPLLENIIFIGVIEFLKCFELGNRTIVLCIAMLSGFAHFLAGGLRAIHGAIAFAIMAFTYLVWSSSPFPKRYAITVMQHVLTNTLPALFLLMSRN